MDSELAQNYVMTVTLQLVMDVRPTDLVSTPTGCVMAEATHQLTLVLNETQDLVQIIYLSPDTEYQIEETEKEQEKKYATMETKRMEMDEHLIEKVLRRDGPELVAA